MDAENAKVKTTHMMTHQLNECMESIFYNLITARPVKKKIRLSGFKACHNIMHGCV